MEIKQPLNIHSNISFILIIIGGLILCPVIAYVLWWIYRVRSNTKGVKPIVKIFNDKKDNLFNIGDVVSNRLQALETKFSSLLGFATLDVSPRTDLALPSTSDWPTSPPRRESIPMLDLHITPEDIQETVKDLNEVLSFEDTRSIYRNKPLKNATNI